MFSSSSGKKLSKSNLALALSILIVCVVILTSSVQSAVPHKRSVPNRNPTNTLEACPTESICGWAVYDRGTRDTLYHVASTTCRCSTEETCYRAEDDLSTSSYIYRCRRRNKNKNRTAGPPVSTNGPNSTSSTSTTTTTTS